MGQKESIPNGCLPYSFATGTGSASDHAVPDNLSLDMLCFDDRRFDNLGLDNL